MNPRHVFAFLLLVACVNSACRTAAIYNVDRMEIVPAAASIVDVQESIDQAGRSLGWKIRTVRDGRAIGIFTRGRHLAQVVIDYDRDWFSVQHMRTVNLQEGDGRVHKTYNRWVKELSNLISVGTGGGQ